MRELAANEIAHRGQVTVGAVAARSHLGGLDAAVDGLSEAVIEMGVEVGEDAVEVVAERGAQSLLARESKRSGGSMRPSLGWQASSSRQ